MHGQSHENLAPRRTRIQCWGLLAPNKQPKLGIIIDYLDIIQQLGYSTWIPSIESWGLNIIQQTHIFPFNWVLENPPKSWKVGRMTTTNPVVELTLSHYFPLFTTTNHQQPSIPNDFPLLTHYFPLSTSNNHRFPTTHQENGTMAPPAVAKPAT